jgi:D-alanine-D-alanine ligase
MAPATGARIATEIGFPLIVKPNGQGSTVGLTLVATEPDLATALEHARSFDGEVMIERYIAGRELTVGILDDAPLAVGEIIPKTGPIFDYAAKYQIGGAEEIFPAPITPEQTARAQDLALRVHRALKLESYSRVDFRMDADGELWALEVNTLPGLTSGSLLPRAAAAVGISFPELCERICKGALAKKKPARE